MINIGIGGSDLGPAMATLALTPYHQGMRCHFVSNVDGAHIYDTLRPLDPRRTLVIIASKTFTTIETMTNAATAIDWLRGGIGEDVGAHLAAVSTALDKTAAMGIAPDRVFGFADWVGGRYSLWGPVGFPESFLAKSDQISQAWRKDFIRTYLERDVPAFGLRIPSETLRRFWTMLAHEQGGLLNAAKLAGNLGVSGQSVARYLDLLVDLMLVRRLPPWYSNAGKRLIKSPKVYIRDSGLTHALLGIETQEDLLGHPVVGGSWEGFCIENLIAAAPRGTEACFYRSSAGAEIDLVLQLPKGAVWAIEIKRTTSPKVTRGFHIATQELDVSERILVYADNREVPGQGGVRAMPLMDAMNRLASV